jgi:radical SAM protein with 4Fe4S-binding SPASM domain
MSFIPFTLSSFAEIFIRDNYCTIVHHQKGNVEIIHPSEAFILSLLDGALTEEDLAAVFSETYDMPREAAASITSIVIRKLGHYLVRSGAAGGRGRYDPLTFLFPGFEKQPNPDSPLIKPQMLGLALTTRCNFRCRYCSLGVNMANPLNMDKDLALRIIGEAADLGVVHASFGGWEPLLHPDICEIVSAITSRGMALLFSTNGSLLSRQMVDELVRAGLKGIQVSIDAPTAEMHHYITQSDDTFHKVISGIERLKDRGVWIKTRSVITSLNLESVPSLIDMLVDMDADQITMGPQHSGSCHVRCENSADKLDPIGLESLQKMVTKKIAQYPDREIIYGDPEKPWHGPEDVVFCSHPATGMMIAANGDVQPCEFIHDKHLLSGNVRESALEEIWLGPDHRRFLERASDPQLVDAECKRCERLQDCHTGCFNLSKIERGDYFAKDPRCPGPERMKKRNV